MTTKCCMIHCEKKATKKCNICEDYFCDECAAIHAEALNANRGSLDRETTFTQIEDPNAKTNDR